MAELDVERLKERWEGRGERYVTAREAPILIAALKDRDRLRAALERLVDEIERKRPLDLAFGPEWADRIHKAQDAGRAALKGRDG